MVITQFFSDLLLFQVTYDALQYSGLGLLFALNFIQILQFYISSKKIAHLNMTALNCDHRETQASIETDNSDNQHETLLNNNDSINNHTMPKNKDSTHHPSLITTSPITHHAPITHRLTLITHHQSPNTQDPPLPKHPSPNTHHVTHYQLLPYHK